MIKYRKDNQHILKCNSHTLPVTCYLKHFFYICNIKSRHIIYHLKDGRAHIFLINITFSSLDTLSVYCMRTKNVIVYVIKIKYINSIIYQIDLRNMLKIYYKFTITQLLGYKSSSLVFIYQT